MVTVRASRNPPTSPSLPLEQAHGFTPLVARYDGLGIVAPCPGRAEYGRGLTRTVVHGACCGSSVISRPNLVERSLRDVLDDIEAELVTVPGSRRYQPEPTARWFQRAGIRR